jgi:hypothetical protein
MNGPALRDIHVPPAQWWPPAPGWWMLAGLLLLIACGIAWWLRHSTRRSPLRAALREIDALEAEYARDGDDTRLADAASRLMRRIARRIAPGVAGQTGASWRAFVMRYARDASTLEALDALADVRFRARPALDAPALLTALRCWCADALRSRASTSFGTQGGAKRTRAKARAKRTRTKARAVQRRGDETRARYAPEKLAP